MGISLREFIRWLPDEASEPTSTIVVTSPGQHLFVDIRVIRPAGETGAWPTEDVTVLPDQIDWAIAGTSSSRPVDGKGAGVTHGQWRHWIDSRTKETEGVIDEGDNYPVPSDGNLTLEKGVMVNPATGEMTEYEEMWRDVEPGTTAAGNAKCVVARFDKADDHRGLIVLFGRYCQGIVRRGGDVAIERWEWVDGSGWKRTVHGGAGPGLPCERILADSASLKVGGTVDVGHEKWEVVEVEYT
ncbi:hypothetical protein GMORB2_4124 [Geosmithia morbida]|uniref:Protein HRI1 n=1 Tax=Geosmithia morbida TaxID=1094350 RepID=A0A9P5D891_9HYPO|nr:uncharacterized protein GMORB2_4124 [Geosmithia morbida]KAF4125284.1 hypothetical protein GMORB2_4124 [Geosmithia morbida]